MNQGKTYVSHAILSKRKKKKKLSTEEFYLEKMQQMAKNFTNGV